MKPNSKHMEWANKILNEYHRGTERIEEVIAQHLAAFEAEVTGWNFDMDAAPKNGELIDLWCERTNLDGDVSYVRKCSVYWGDVSHQFTHEEYKAWIGIYEQFADIRPVAWREITLPVQPETEE